MIRIDLGKKQSKSSASIKPPQGGGLDGDSAMPDQDQGIVKKEALKNLIILLIGSFLLFAYEQVHIPELKSELQINQVELNKLKEKNQKAEQAVKTIRKLREDEEKVKAQIDAIDNLKKGRMDSVKILELVHKNIPNHVWLRSMTMAKDKLEIAGYAITDNDLTNFMESLQKSIYFKEVRLLRSKEENLPKHGNVKKIDIVCVLGSINE